MMPKLLRFAVLVAVFILGGLLGRAWLPDEEPDPMASDPAHTEAPEILYWVAPMDPNYRRDEPGKSPMGMDLVPVYADRQSGDGGVSIDPTVVANLGVRTAPAERGPLARTIDTVGHVTYDEETIQHVHTRVDGWIESLAVNATGDPVSEGQRLFELYSPTLVNAQQEYLAARAGGNAALRSASRERLAALGMDAAAIERLERERTVVQRVPFTAARDGIIAHLGVREGIFITPETEVLSVANLDAVWVIAEVLARQSDWVEAGQRATVRLEHRPDAPLAAVVDYVYPELDPVSRTLRVRLRLDNADRTLRPNMYARVQLAGRGIDSIVHVPRAAVIRSSRGNRVVVQDGEGRFSQRDVLVGIESGDRVAIRRGLAEGERVVISGQFLIDSEASLDTALDRIAPEPPGHEGHGS
ncbi:MAG: efflux RND transporter periplasmic adaptor subunit [Xanthomonadales bacterium]|jgi:Cu(I)/Ag(I) efflux system membrane fusion protein|nr:efflux RND transporter periplasmic adaptor subunit [Xanthomonadales bacterium]